MCINPILTPDGHEIGCRNCWQCKERRVNDWVGRCIAESKTTHSAYSCTFTYGRDEFGNENHERAKVLTYSDVQKLFKRMRADGLKFKYFAVGEYGTLKSRAHWHIMLYSQTPMEVELYRNYQFKYWPHGHTYIEPANASSVRYICKYILKDTKDSAKQYHLAMSKKPPIGHEYFQQLAQTYVDNYLAPQDLLYTFPEATDINGNKIKFIMSSVTAENFLAAYCRKWAAQRGGWCPSSDLVEEYLDSLQIDWRLPEKLAKAQARADKERADPKYQDKLLFRAQHHEYYFGAEARKLWENFDG